MNSTPCTATRRPCLLQISPTHRLLPLETRARARVRVRRQVAVLLPLLEPRRGQERLAPQQLKNHSEAPTFRLVSVEQTMRTHY